MRIAIINERWGAGAARCAHDLHTALCQTHEIVFFPKDEHHTAGSVLRDLADFKPDVVNCHSFYGDLPYDVLAKISRSFPVCFTVHDPRPVGTMETTCWSCQHNAWCISCPLVGKRWRQLIRNRFFGERLRKRWCHLHCAKDMRLVAPSQWMASRLLKHELRRFKVEVIPNGVDLDKFRPTLPERPRFKLPVGSPVILYVAWHSGDWTINQRKGLKYLAEAFVKTVVTQFPSAVLAVAGEAFAPNHPNVCPLGMVDQAELPSLLNAADIFVSPTLADNFPYTILEAMACGKAVVASDVGGIPEQVIDGQTGYLVPPANVFELGKALVRLLSKPEDVSRFGKAGRARAEQLFGMARFINSYETIFNEMIR